jgi:hypothetical protein
MRDIRHYEVERNEEQERYEEKDRRRIDRRIGRRRYVLYRKAIQKNEF